MTYPMWWSAVFQLAMIWLLAHPTSSERSVLDSLVTIERQLLNDFRIHLQHNLEGSRIRRKRQAGLLAVTDSGSTEEHLRVGDYSAKDLPNISEHILTMWTTVVHNETNQVFIGTQAGDLILLDVTEENVPVVLAKRSGEVLGLKAKAFSYYDEQWFIVLQFKNMQNFLQLYLLVGSELQPKQSIRLVGPSDIDIVTVHGIHYLVVATYGSRLSYGFNYEGKVELYHWTHTQFDLLDTRTTYGARSIACWTLDGVLYLSVAQEVNNEKNFFTGSPLFIFNSKEKNKMVLLDRLRTKGPKKISYFFVGGSHYLLYTGHYDAEIFWWTSGQFLSWQIIEDTAQASDSAVLTLQNSEIILAIILQEKILYLTLDKTGHYAVSFSMKFSGFIISSAQFMFDGSDYYVLVLFAASFHKPPSIYKLDLHKYNLPTVREIDPMMQCLSSLRGAVTRRNTELQGLQVDLNRIWVTNREQVVTAPVTLEGYTSSKSTVIDEIHISNNETTLQAPSHMYDQISLISSSIQSAGWESRNILLKSKAQIVRGNINFLKPLFAPSLNMDTLNEDIVINDLPVLNLAMNGLRKTGNQIARGSNVFEKIFTKNVLVHGINGIIPNDLLLLTGKQHVTGNHTYSQIHGTDIVTSFINSVHIDDIVIRNAKQDIMEKKFFKNLHLGDVLVKDQTNGVYLQDLISKIVTTNTNQDIGRTLAFHSMHIEGNINATRPINDVIDLNVLNSHTVKVNSNQEIEGRKKFLAPLTVAAGFSVAGLVNGIALQHVVTSSTEQIITGKWQLDEVTILGSIVTGTVNGIDLREEAVRNSEEAFVYGHKTFYSHLVANSIEVLEFVTIDGVDISNEAASVIKYKEGIINISPSFANLIVRGNLTAMGGINGFAVSDLTEIAWLKTLPQEIDIPVSFGGAVAIDHDLSVNTINNLNLETDVVPVIGDSTIFSQKVFSGDVNVLNIDTSGSYFNGLDLESFREQEIQIDNIGHGMIYGNKVLNGLVINGNVALGSMNGLTIPEDLVQPDTIQEIEGDISAPIIIVSGDLKITNVEISFFNDINFKTFSDNAVLKRNASKVLSNKNFVHLTADKMLISSGGLIDGLDVLDRMLKAVTLDSNNLISEKHFVDINVEELKVKNVNGMDFENIVNSVISVSSPSVNGAKSFQGSVKVGHFTVGTLNGINITEMDEYALSKTKKQTISARMHFNSVQIGSLHLSRRATLDGMLLNDLVLLYGTEEFTQDLWFQQVVVQDISVNGLVNGCNFNKIKETALQSYKDFQVVNGLMNLKNFNIQGNLVIQGNANNVSLEALKEIIASKDGQVMLGEFNIHSGITVDHITISGLINGIDLGLLISDAVKKTVPQFITGPKTFATDLEVEVLVGTVDIDLSGNLNHINLKNLLEEVVWKSGDQRIYEDKAFQSLKAHNMIVHGYLNGITLPHDVITTTDTEVISSPTHFTTDITIKSNISVTRYINGVSLDLLLSDRITLTDHEEISSEITFLKDVAVYGHMSIDALLNNIRLDKIATVNGNLIHGSKYFHGGLNIENNLKVHLINGFNIEDFAHSIVSLSKNENLTIQVFAEPLFAQNSLFVNTINEVSLPMLVKGFLEQSSSISSTLDYMNDLSNIHDEKLTALQISLKSASVYAYFVLQQEIVLNTVMKILAGYSERSNGLFFSQKMVAWSRKHYCLYEGKCCSMDYSYWLHVDENAVVSIRQSRESGRYFPLQIFDQKFVIWTNSTLQPSWCHQHNAAETFIGRVTEAGIEVQHKIWNSPMLTEAKVFKEVHLYVIAGFYYDTRYNDYSPSIVYRANELKANWVEHQTLALPGVISMDLTTYQHSQETDILLILGTGINAYPISYSTVLKWNYTSLRFEQFQRVPSRYASSVLWIQRGGQLFLAIANLEKWSDDREECHKQNAGGYVNIYAYGRTLQWIQTIHLQGVVSMDYYELEGETYMAAASKQMGTVSILQWKGYNGFDHVQTITARDVNHVSTFWSNEELYMNVASGAGSSKVLKAVVRGKHFKYISNSINTTTTLGDQPIKQKPESSC